MYIYVLFLQWSMQAATYKEDFERERSDRERAAAKIDFLEEKVESQKRKEAEQKRQIDLLLTTEAEQKQKLAERFQSEIDEERKKVKKALEEVHVKASQVKQHKKQVKDITSNASVVVYSHVNISKVLK